MSTKAQVKTQAKTPAAPAAARIPQPPVAEPEHEAERPDIAAQLEGATRLGHRFGALGVDGSALPTIQRQEIPEEEEELQLKTASGVQRQFEEGEDASQPKPLAVSATPPVQRRWDVQYVTPRVYPNIIGLLLRWQGMPPAHPPLRRRGLSGYVPMPEEELQGVQGMPLAHPPLRRSGSSGYVPIQRVGLEGGLVPPEVEAAINRARGGGQPLEGAVQAQMSEALGHDFSRVRVHTDSEANDLNRQLSAKAFTTGSDIFFERGVYEPGSSSGRELIAHELSHVVQQSSGRVNGDGSGMTVRPAGEAFEQEADRVAEAVTRSMNTSVQRQTPEEVEIQRDDEGEGTQTHISEGRPVNGSEDFEARINGARGSGQSLLSEVREPKEKSFEAEFRDVRVHNDWEADSFNRQLRAKFFTIGTVISFMHAGCESDREAMRRAVANSGRASQDGISALHRPVGSQAALGQTARRGPCARGDEGAALHNIGQPPFGRPLARQTPPPQMLIAQRVVTAPHDWPLQRVGGQREEQGGEEAGVPEPAQPVQVAIPYADQAADVVDGVPLRDWAELFRRYISAVRFVRYYARSETNALSGRDTDCMGFARGFQSCIRVAYQQWWPDLVGEAEAVREHTAPDTWYNVIVEMPTNRMSVGNLKQRQFSWFDNHKVIPLEGDYYDATTGRSGQRVDLLAVDEVPLYEKGMARQEGTRVVRKAGGVHPEGGRYYDYGCWQRPRSGLAARFRWRWQPLVLPSR